MDWEISVHDCAIDKDGNATPHNPGEKYPYDLFAGTEEEAHTETRRRGLLYFKKNNMPLNMGYMEIPAYYIKQKNTYYA